MRGSSAGNGRRTGLDALRSDGLAGSRKASSSVSSAAISAAIASSNSSRWAGSMRSDLAANYTRRSLAISCVSLLIFASLNAIAWSRWAMACL